MINCLITNPNRSIYGFSTREVFRDFTNGRRIVIESSLSSPLGYLYNFLFIGHEGQCKNIMDAIEMEVSSGLVSTASIHRFNQLINGDHDNTLKRMNLQEISSRISDVGKYGDVSHLSIEVERNETIDNDQPFVINDRFYYENDAANGMVCEAIGIFLHTQLERLLSLIISIVQRIFSPCGLLSDDTYNQFHYFNEREIDDTIYSMDEPNISSSSISISWQGHATTLINIPVGDSHFYILTDPVEGSLSSLFYPRQTKPAWSVDDLPGIHLISISHNHRDHLDIPTLKKLVPLQPIVMVPLGDKPLLTSLGFEKVFENKWWQKTNFKYRTKRGSEGDISITFVPSNHWSGRTLLDKNCSLFGGYIFSSKDDSIYFAGDTAKLDEAHLNRILQYKPSLLIQSAGPDEPRYLMESTHVCSAESLLTHLKSIINKMSNDEGATPLERLERASKKTTSFLVHMKTFKLGTLHFNDAEKSIARVIKALRSGHDNLTRYERFIFEEIKALCSLHDLPLSEVSDILERSVVIPKIGKTISI